MIETIIKKVFGDADTKKLKGYSKDLAKIRELEQSFANMTLEDIKKRTTEIKKSFEGIDFETEDGTKALKEWLGSIKHEAGALWLRACACINNQTHTLPNGKELEWNMLPYDVQVIGGLAIHDGNVAEMKTWEWKTLVATFPAYLNALTGNTVHIVTVNDYLASRDAM